MSAPQCPPILTREQLVARMAYAISPYAWGSMDHPKCRAKAQKNAMRAAEMALREVEQAIVAHLDKTAGPNTLSAAGAAHEIAHLVVRRKA